MLEKPKRREHSSHRSSILKFEYDYKRCPCGSHRDRQAFAVAKAGLVCEWQRLSKSIISHQFLLLSLQNIPR